jgi:GNAT superfamily N-acetyltransferase
MAAKRKMPHGKAAHMLCQPLIARAYPATMDIMPFTLRQATVADADAIAEVYSASFRLLTFLPMLHTVADNRSFVANVIFKNCEVIVAEDDSGIVSFLARQGEEVRLLYTRPDRIGRGVGTQLIEAAKKSGTEALELWCFQANARARCFYEARGFHPIRFTDGADNEEKTPDVRYRWELAVGSS